VAQDTILRHLLAAMFIKTVAQDTILRHSLAASIN